MANFYDGRSIINASIASSSFQDGFSRYDSKLSKEKFLQVLVNLYSEKETWNKYGELKPFCKGVFLISPVKTWWWMTQVFVLITIVVFTYEFFFYNWLMVVPAVILALLECMAFYKTCMRDPGIQPRDDFVTAFRNLLQVLAAWQRMGSRGAVRVITHPNGAIEQLNFCWRCNHFRVGTTSHCGTCDCCMIQHDHHCPVYGGCVAKKNTSAFHTMAISMACYWVFIFVYTIYNLATTTVGLYHPENGKLAAKPTFYLIMVELFAVLTVPTLIRWCLRITGRQKKKKSFMPPSVPINKDLLEQMIKFAEENNFTAEETFYLRQIILVDEGIGTDGSILESQDMTNHNHSGNSIAPTTAIVV